MLGFLPFFWAFGGVSEKMKLKDLQKYDGKEVIAISHGKHITGKLQVLERTVVVGKKEMLPGQIDSIEDITPQ